VNILHLLSQNHLTGAEVYAATLAAEQCKKNHQVFQISNGFFYPTLATQHPLSVETKSKFKFISNVFWLKRFLHKHKIDVVHTHSRASAKLAYWVTLGTKTAVVSTVHGQQHSSLSKKIFNQYGQLIIAVCENIKNHLVTDFNYRSEMIKVVRNPIDQNIFYFSAKPRNQKIKIALIGRTTGPKKERTEQVLQSLADININADIFLVGGAKNDLALGASVLDRLQEVSVSSLTAKDYAGYDLVIGSGRVCMEAVLTGVPTIAFGEAQYIGLIRNAHFQLALFSNFGDIDVQSSGPKIDLNKFKADIEQIMNAELKEEELRQLSEKAATEFSLSSIAAKISRLYESAIFLKRYSSWIPVLMYHKIPEHEIQSQHKIFVTRDNFEKHLQFYKAQGFQTLTFSDLEHFRSGTRSFNEFPRKPLILTFDDGYQDNLDHASPLLKKYNFKAQIFLLADPNIRNNQWDASSDEPAHEIVSGAERKKWLHSAFEIGSHGFSHQKITEMTDEQALTELKQSKLALEKEFAISVNVFAFTYGDTNKKSAKLAADAGYQYAVNTDTGAFLIEESPFQIFRVNIFPHETSWSLFKKTAKWYRRYYFWKRKK
jgi:peptidoglycan/xylan/chitin deacetylase (PgdA/CDA1 family)